MGMTIVPAAYNHGTQSVSNEDASLPALRAGPSYHT